MRLFRSAVQFIVVNPQLILAMTAMLQIDSNYLSRRLTILDVLMITDRLASISRRHHLPRV